MDRQSVLGFILIFLVLMIWVWMSAPPQKQVDHDSTSVVQPRDSVLSARPKASDLQLAATSAASDYGRFFSGRETGIEKTIIVETGKSRIELSSKGGLVRRYVLKEYQTWNGYPVQLIDFDRGGDLSLLFATTDGRIVNTRNLYFDVPYRTWQTVTLEGTEEYGVEFILPSANGGKIIKKYSFKNGEYGFKVELKFVNMGSVVANFEYQVVWETGLRYTEFDSMGESNFAAAYAFAGGELTELDASTVGEEVSKDLTGAIDWVGTRTKYFAVAIVPKKGESEGAYLEGIRRPLPDRGAREGYSVALKVPFKGNMEETFGLDIFLGPLEYNTLSSYGRDLEEMMSLGWAWIIRPISVYIILPLFKFLNLFIPNWGIVLIIFSIIVKIALHPLTKTSMKSMKKMQALQPMMEEIRTKYKDDPQKMNQQIMGLYRDYGVNPAGGCLPLLLQFPILFALYSVFMSAIELRQAEFVWWIADLSVPDRIFSLPFELPLFGIRDVSGLALLMGITMFIQQKMSVKDPRQKMMVWLMPVMLTLLFNGFPAGLNLYYFVFNLLSIGQQFYINKQHGDEPLRKVEPKKRSRGGIFGKYTKDLPRFKR
ncbi:MAG: membrane protein insertase YidC [Ignavibacteria bacterium]|nr:membrane protein insertase YidC [Ignavibacteria bacterium]